ncbi:MAG TPA: hypothetical protein VLH10_24275, partial [Yinghuangia sp.]|nr:hypothetical protein [Yinghuangia sp.]
AVVGERADRVVEEIGAIPWDAVLRRHAAKPINGEALECLAVRSDCPRELLPVVVEEFSVADLGWALESVLRQRLTAEEILRDAVPAAAAAGLLADSGYGGGPDFGARLAEAGAELRRILGDSPDAWAVAVHLLPDFSGTLTELAATAAAAVGP